MFFCLKSDLSSSDFIPQHCVMFNLDHEERKQPGLAGAESSPLLATLIPGSIFASSNSYIARCPFHKCRNVSAGWFRHMFPLPKCLL